MGRTVTGVPYFISARLTYWLGYGGSGQVLFFGVGFVQDDPGVEGDETLGRGQERVYVELPDPGLLDDEPREAHEQPLHGSQIYRRPSPDALQRLGDAGPLDHPACQRRGERR
jgi:hypothetical protein